MLDERNSAALVSLLHPARVAIAANIHQDRKSTRLNSSHVEISYAVFCLKKKNHPNIQPIDDPGQVPALFGVDALRLIDEDALDLAGLEMLAHCLKKVIIAGIELVVLRTH